MPFQQSNIAREVALTWACTVFRLFGDRSLRNRTSNRSQLVEAIWAGAADVVVAGGVDALKYACSTPKSVIDVNKAQRAMDLIWTLAQINLKDLLPNPPSLTERYTGKTMGQHAEEMARININRKSQELYSIQSHQKAASQKQRVTLNHSQ